MSSIGQVNPRDLIEHPWQSALYSHKNAYQEREFEELVDSVKREGVLIPCIVVRGMPSAAKGGPPVQDHTIISGHRRVAAAIKLGLETVPVEYRNWPNHAEAHAVYLGSNAYRVKNEWTKLRERDFHLEVARMRAAFREQEGQAKGRETQAAKRQEKVVVPASGHHQQMLVKLPPKNRADVEVAKQTDVGKETVHLGAKLSTLAKEQNPEYPEQSEVARDLQAGMKVKTAARKYGLIKEKKNDPDRIIRSILRLASQLDADGRARLLKELRGFCQK